MRMIKFSFTLFPLLAIGAHADLFCYEGTKEECASHHFSPICTTTYGNFPNVQGKFQQLANMHIARSNQALMVAKHFSNYQEARDGFHDLFLSQSQYLYKCAAGIIRYIVKRGGDMDFSNVVDVDETNGFYEFNELKSLSWLSDSQKRINQAVFDLDALVGGPDPHYHDGDASYYLQSLLVYDDMWNLREVTDFYVKLETMETTTNQMLALFDMDDYISARVENYYDGDLDVVPL